MSGAARLEILSGDLTGRRYKLDEPEFVIGRSPRCDLVIPKKYISREHARIVCDGGEFIIDGLSEKNPVTVGKQAIREHPLADGDEFELCGIRIRFRAPAARARTRAQTDNSPRRVAAASGGGAIGGGPKDSWQDDGPPADAAEDSWRDDAAEDSWRNDAPPAHDDESWERSTGVAKGDAKGDQAEDSWSKDDDEDADWRNEASFAATSGPKVSNPEAVVFDVGPAADPSDQTGDLPLKKLSALSSRGSGSGVGGHGESSNERTAELNKHLDPDDPDYDPFANVEGSKKKERTVDPAKEKLLRVLSILGLVGIGLAVVVQKRIDTKGPVQIIEVEVPIQLKVNQVLMFEEPWAEDDKPQTTAKTRRNGVPQSEDYLTKDPYAEVEWLVPHVSRRSVLLIRAIEEGETSFEMAFPESNRIKRWKVIVEGADPHDSARDARRAELRKKPERELRRLVNQRLARGKTLTRERDSPGKESFYRRSYVEFTNATDAATAWSEQLARQGRASKDVHRLLRRCEDAESKSRDEWERFIEQQIAIYEAMVGRSESPEESVRQLKRVLRGIAHNCDVRYKRLSTLLTEGWRSPNPDDFKCKHDIQ